MRTIGWVLLAITSFFVVLTGLSKAAQKAVEEQVKSGNFDFAQALHDVVTNGCYSYLLVLMFVWLVLLTTSSNH